MKTVTGRVVGNTVVLDEPLPEGASVEVVVTMSNAHSPPGIYAQIDDHELVIFDEATIAELHARCAEADVGASFVPVEEVLAEFHTSRKK